MVVRVLGHLRLLVTHAAQGAGGAGVLLAAALSLHCTNTHNIMMALVILNNPNLKMLICHMASRPENKSSCP